MKSPTRRPVSSYAKVRALIGRTLRNRRLFLPWDRIESREYLDIGCGPNISPSFVNLDYDWKPGVDVVWDITRGLPFRSSSLKGVFTEHCLEHISFSQTESVFGEIFRVLMPGGRARVIVPDGEIYLAGYNRQIGPEKGAPLPFWESDKVRDWYSPILSVNRIFRAHEHKFIYDFDTMKHLLRDSGFAAIAKCAFKQGKDPVLLRDTEHRQCESLYVEAVKPT
jgi:predicted SAM-dependent methyltransferase